MRISSLSVDAYEGTTEFEFGLPAELHASIVAHPLWMSENGQSITIWLSKETANRLRAALDARFPVAEPISQEESHAQN